MKIVFGTDGWRARMDDSFTIENVKLVAQAIADYLSQQNLKKKGLVIGFDTRSNSERFAQACSQVMSANEIPVYIAERAMPTPVTAFAITALQAAGAIMITASHNPPEYNGIKFIPGYAGPASPEITNSIVENISGLVPSEIETDENNSLAEFIDPVPEYIEYLQKLVDFDALGAKRLKVVLDPMYGAGYGIADTIFEKAGCDVTTIHNYADSLFGGSFPEPTLEHLNQLRLAMQEHNADLGLALDGDADRFGVINPSGEYVPPNQVLALLSLHLLKNRQFEGILVRSVATTHLLDAIAEKHNIGLYETPKVGFKYIAQVVMKKPVVLGGEESGGLCIKGSIPEKDGILADLLLAEMMAYENKPLLVIMDEINQEYGYFYNERLDIQFPIDQKESLLKRLVDSPPALLAGKKLDDVTTEDGVRYLLNGGDWILVRPSGTEPLVRIYIESRSREGFDQLKMYALEITSRV